MEKVPGLERQASENQAWKEMQLGKVEGNPNRLIGIILMVCYNPQRTSKNWVGFHPIYTLNSKLHMGWNASRSHWDGIYFQLLILSGQIIATSHDLTPNGGLLREIFLFQGNPGSQSLHGACAVFQGIGSGFGYGMFIYVFTTTSFMVGVGEVLWHVWFDILQFDI